MAVQIRTLKVGDVLYYPLPKHGYHRLTVESVDPETGTAVVDLNGRKNKITQRNCNRYRRTPPKTR
jgi:hypothetical protein